MIVTNLIGGLGNQMFQYAFGRALSMRYGVPLMLDIFDFRKYQLHTGFALQSVFSLPAEQVNDDGRHAVLGWRSRLPILKLLRRQAFSRLRGNRLLVQDITQPAAHTISATSDDCYLIGYWQSENYFSAVSDQIRRDFTFVPALSDMNAQWAERIRNCTAISIHVRRGDYVSNPRTFALHGVCSLDYYRRAIAHLEERTVRPEFFVFSDDLNWVRNHLRIQHPHHFVDYNAGAASFNDMHLMSLCKHHIIANSSFSWWGAWLSSYAEKIVVAPARWLVDIELPDIVPDRWVRL